MDSQANERILLPGPDVSHVEREALLRAFDGGWIAPLGPELAAFEQELPTTLGPNHALVSRLAPAALQLALQIKGRAGRSGGSERTFAASAFAVVHAGAVPVFADIDPNTWGLDANPPCRMAGPTSRTRPSPGRHHAGRFAWVLPRS
ncbi:MAG: DegT/DnrJ/EryC1/StrS family aminotransferase [Acidimicrobiales bacterium]